MRFAYPVLGLLVCALVGCASRSHRVVADSQISPVREVRFIGTPEHWELAERARAVGNAFYPQIWAALNDGSREAPPFDIIFRNDLARHRSHANRGAENTPRMTHSAGVAIGGSIYVNTGTVLKEPAALEFILLHEMAHVAQRYNWYRRVTMPRYWQEGIAEAMVFKLEKVNIPKDRPRKCSTVWPHYMSGYSCAAAFLLYLEKTYDSRIVSRLNSAIRDGSYSDDFFHESTGRTLDQLWSEFLQTSNVTAMAAKINRIYDELGYRNGKFPSDAKARFNAYLAKQPNGDELIRMRDVWAGEITEIKTLITRGVYFAGAGGAILAAMNLHMQNRLPGISEGDNVSIWPASSMFEVDVGEQDESPQEIRARKEGDAWTHHYEFVRARENRGWTLAKAWCTDERGVVVEQYFIERK